MRIYIAGPYSAAAPDQVEQNVAKAIDAAIEVLRKGHWPFVPHLTHFVELRAKSRGLSISWEEYVAWDLKWLEVCDGLLLLGSSPGANIELEKARALGIRVFDSLANI